MLDLVYNGPARCLPHLPTLTTIAWSAIMADSLVLTDKQIRNFWAKVDTSHPSGCWLWTGQTSKGNGYGNFSLTLSKGVYTMKGAHVVALHLDGRPKPSPDMQVRHADNCISRACVNPEHLCWGTSKDNADDKRRIGSLLTGERNPVSKLDEAKVIEILGSDVGSTILARRLGVSPGLVQQVRRGQIWKHIARPDRLPEIRRKSGFRGLS